MSKKYRTLWENQREMRLVYEGMENGQKRKDHSVFTVTVAYGAEN